MKIIKNLVFFFTLFLMVFLIVSCDLDKEPTIVKLSDSRFNGEFWDHGAGNKFDKLEFNGTNKVQNSYNTYQYFYDIKFSTLEFEVKDGKYRYRLWSEYDTNWLVDWSDYSFNSDGTKLFLQSRPGSTVTFTYEKRQ